MRVLLIEDERKVADAIVRGLRAERHVVDVAYDGDDGWVRASNSDYDVIVLDLMLPGLSGREVLQRLRRQQSQAAVMVLTARDATDDKVALFEIGADDYLTKPFAFAELRARLLALTRRPHTTRTHLLRVADLELDRLTREVRRASRRIELTSKEYALLEYMLAHSGRVLTRNMILEPRREDFFHRMREADDAVGGSCRPGSPCGFEDGRNFVVVQSRDNRRDDDPCRDTRLGELRDGIETPGRGRGARLQAARELRVQRGHRDVRRAEALLGHHGKDVEIARDEVVFGDDTDRISEFRQHLQALPRDAETVFDRLVAVRDGTQGQHLRLPARRPKLLSEKFGRVFLDDDARLEIQP